MSLLHLLRRADSLAAWTAGRSMPMSVPMMAITTSSSTSVNPARLFLICMEVFIKRVP
jgi:hypothetical protein